MGGINNGGTAVQNVTADDQSGGNSTGLLGGLGSWLGTNSTFQADPYGGTNRDDFNYSGPDTGKFLAGSQGQSAADYAQSQQDRGQQGSYLKSLQDAAAGNGPSTALGVLQQGTNAANANAISLARSASGSNPAAQAAALRSAQMQGAANTTNAGAQAAQIKGNEQIAAMNAGTNMINTQRGQDLQSMGMGNQMAGNYLNAGVQGSIAQQQGTEAYDQLQSGNYNAAQALNSGISQSNAQSNGQMLGGIVQGAGALAMMSDIRSKTNITPAVSEGTKAKDKEPQSFGQGVGNAFQAFGRGISGQPPMAMPAQQAPQAPAPAMAPAPAQNLNAGYGPNMGAPGGPAVYDISNGAANAVPSRMMSDEETKGQRAKGTNDADSFLGTLKPYTYNYKDASDEPTDEPHGGRYLGIMAQNVERGPTGDTLVAETPRGKAIEGGAMLGALAGGVGRIHERLSQLEAMAKRRAA